MLDTAARWWRFSPFVAESLLGRRAPLQAVPHSDDSERGKYFYNPGVVSGIQSLGKKCSYLPHAYSVLAEIRVSWPVG